METHRQKTLNRSVSLEGVGLHTGAPVTMTFEPAPAGSGFKFRRADMEGQPEIPALAHLVINTDRGTTLGRGEVKVYTVEHVLAALVGMDVDNCTIILTGPEPPIGDGSSAPFVALIEEAGVVEQEAEREYFVVREPIHFALPEEGIEILAVPDEGTQFHVMVDYGTKVLGSQNAHLSQVSDFKSSISKARTFSFLHELEYMLDNGLIKGGDLNNAIVYVDRELNAKSMEKLRGAFKKDQVAVQANGILDNLELYYPNEAARHKLLDVMGDLALAGKRFKGRIYATKPGHRANTEFAKILQEVIRKDSNAPVYDPNQAPLMDVTEVMKRLPHRPPFLLVDKIIELTANGCVGVKAITMNEPFFVGHFPGAPVMPGVLLVEAMAQTGGIFALSTVPDPENYLTYFMKLDQVKFKSKVVPGDTVLFRLRLLSPIRRGIVHMFGQAYVGHKLVMEGELTAQIVKEKQ
jgi:UDP-3-O-[3-hydroxymyristoyl] N-acetylglucosamine deacetylase/3-hydroxyacyl-[acyl-carrier-protein] dehydratase